MSLSDGAPKGFGVTVDFNDEQAVLVVRGELDLATAPVLGTFLDAVIASGSPSVVMNLGQLDFIDLAGLRVITFAASRLVGSGGELMIRSPSAMFRRILTITGMSDVLSLEQHELPPHRLGAEQVTAQSVLENTSAAPHRTEPLARLTALPANDDVVDGALRLVVALARATVGGADGVSLSLRRHGRLSTVAASDQTISDMDTSQYATGEGPCVDASLKGRWFHAESLDTESRWPKFTPRARALGINAILSSPLLTENRPVGALNIYSRTSTAFTSKDQELAAVFAKEASRILSEAGVDVTEPVLAARLGEAQRIRRTIAQAEGIIMEREAIPADSAYSVLRSYSQRTNRPLRFWAEEVVESTQRNSPDGQHGPASRP